MQSRDFLKMCKIKFYTMKTVWQFKKGGIDQWLFIRNIVTVQSRSFLKILKIKFYIIKSVWGWGQVGEGG